MRFGAVPLAEAQGAILAHSVAVATGRLRKGKRLTAADLEALAQAGLSDVTVARLDPGDIDEDHAAARLADAVAGAGLSVTQAATGRVNIHAQGAGIIQVNQSAVEALNLVDPMITLATVPPWQRLSSGGMVATVKIISYAVSEAALIGACAAGAGALSLCPPRYRSAALIQTRVPGQQGMKGHGALAERMQRLGLSLAPEQVVAHEVAPLAQAIAESSAEVLFLLTGSATSDIGDVAPEALCRAGGQVDHFGLPVDPGNLLFLGRIGTCPVIGLPGCARAPALNGADWVLERVICNGALRRQDIAAMGVGGLLKDIAQRGRPRSA